MFPGSMPESQAAESAVQLTLADSVVLEDSTQ